MWETVYFKNIFKSCTNISLHEGGKFTPTFLMKATVVSGYSSTLCSNLGNLCLASMEFSLMAFSMQTVTVSGNCFTHELPIFISSVTWNRLCFIQSNKILENFIEITPNKSAASETQCLSVLYLLSRKKGHYWTVIKARVMWLGEDMHIVPRNMFTKFHLKMLNSFWVMR